MAKPQKEAPMASVDQMRAAFHERMHANHMYGLWELASQMTPQPQPKMIPYMWPWSRLKSIVDESGSAVPVGEERRALQLFNPGLDGRWATTNNLIAAVQVLLPGEVARAHRHSPTAIRFIIEGTRCLYRRRWRARLYGAGRSHTDAELGLARPRQRDEGACRLDGRAGHSLDPILGSDVLPVLQTPSRCRRPGRPTPPSSCTATRT